MKRHAIIAATILAATFATTAHADDAADSNMARATIYNDQCEPLSMNGVDVWYMARVSLRRGFITLEGFNAASRKIRDEVAAQLIRREPNSLDGPSPARAWCAANEATVKQFLTTTFRVTDR